MKRRGKKKKDGLVEVGANNMMGESEKETQAEIPTVRKLTALKGRAIQYSAT